MTQPRIIWRAPIREDFPEARELALLLQRFTGYRCAVSAMETSSTSAPVIAPHYLRRDFDLADCFICLAPPPGAMADPLAPLNILRTGFTLTGIAPEWRKSLAAFSLFAVYTEKDRQILLSEGIENALVVPALIDTDIFNASAELLNHPDFKHQVLTAFIHYDAFAGVDALWKTYFKNFSDKDGVSLVIVLDTPRNDIATLYHNELNQFLAHESIGSPAHHLLLKGPLNASQRAALMRRSACVLDVSRLAPSPYITAEARACGARVVTAEEAAGQAQAIPEVLLKNRPDLRGHMWLEPDEAKLAQILKAALDRPTGQEAAKAWDLGSASWDELLQRVNTGPSRESLAPPTLFFEGPFFVNESLAHVNRSLAKAWLRQDHKDFEICPLEFRPEHGLLETEPALKDKIRTVTAKGTRVLLRHSWPPRLDKTDEKLFLIQPWELTSIPQKWVEPLKTNVDELWVPSHFVKKAFASSGVPEEKIHVIPNGIDPTVMQPDGDIPLLPIRRSVKFLFVGGTISRKGIDLLLKAWETTFTSQDDVTLIIKDMGTGGAYRSQHHRRRILEMQQNAGLAPILYMDSFLTEAQMASLYRLATVTVLPYRGEGFCLPALESLACGTPIAVTAGGPTDDFCTAQNSYRIKAQFKPVQVLEPYAHPPQWLEPDFDDLCRQLRHIATHPEEALEKSDSENLRHQWSWEKAAQAAWARLQKIIK